MATLTLPSETLQRPSMSLELLRQARIRFLHPGYPDDQNTLLDLPRVDLGPSNVGRTRIAGVHHGTALVACQIIANNAFDSRLAQDTGGQHLAEVPLDSILTRDVYYFFIGDGSRMYLSIPYLPNHNAFPANSLLFLGQYPIVPSFTDWKFPHDCIPETWLSAVHASPDCFGSVTVCAIAGFGVLVDAVHLVHREECL